MNVFRRVVFLVCAGLCLASCGKMREVVDKAKELAETKKTELVSAEVESVNEKQGKKIIATEPGLVMVEFYSDT